MVKKRNKLQGVSKEEFEKLYYNENKTLKDIGNIFGCSGALVFITMKKFGIKLRSKTENSKKYNISKEQLKKYYTDKELTIKEVSKIFGCAQSTIYNLLVKYDLIRSQRFNISKESINDLYWNKDWLVKDIANKFNCSAYAIRYKIKKFGIKFKYERK